MEIAVHTTIQQDLKMTDLSQEGKVKLNKSLSVVIFLHIRETKKN